MEEEKRAESASQPRYAVVTCPLAYSFVMSISSKIFEKLRFLIKYAFFTLYGD